MKHCLILSIYISLSMLYASQPWTHCYIQTFDAAQPSIQFRKTATIPFTQLILSWNMPRPEKGTITFRGRIRDAKSKQWHAWHRLMSWGEKQCSFFHKTQTSANYYVRLETHGALADGFEIMAQSHDGAVIEDAALAVTVSQLKQFKAEDSSIYRELPSVILSNVPKVSQMLLAHPDRERVCSPTSMMMVGAYLAHKEIDEQFIDGVYDCGLDTFGSWAFNCAHLYAWLHGSHYCFVRRLPSFKSVYQLLKRGIPVPVSIRGTLTGAPKPYPHGHFVVIIGYDATSHTIRCHDPAVIPAEDESDIVVCKAYDCAEFLSAWERSLRLAYYIVPHDTLRTIT